MFPSVQLDGSGDGDDGEGSGCDSAMVGGCGVTSKGGGFPGGAPRLPFWEQNQSVIPSAIKSEHYILRTFPGWGTAARKLEKRNWDLVEIRMGVVLRNKIREKIILYSS